MSNFIYTFSKEGRDHLLALQYEMLKCDDERGVYVFLNKECRNFTTSEFKYALSDTLTF